MPVSEAALWQQIRKSQLGVRFRRQVPIGPYIADFACLNPRVVVEVDGDSHLGRAESARTAFLEAQGFSVIRIDNEDVAFDDGLLTEWIKTQIDELRRNQT